MHKPTAIICTLNETCMAATCIHPTPPNATQNCMTRQNSVQVELDTQKLLLTRHEDTITPDESSPASVCRRGRGEGQHTLTTACTVISINSARSIKQRAQEDCKEHVRSSSECYRTLPMTAGDAGHQVGCNDHKTSLWDMYLCAVLLRICNHIFQSTMNSWQMRI